MNIWQIEITNDCNFSCNYCPRTKLMTRKKGTMSHATIDRIADICTSKWIRLHQFGESLLKPDMCVYAIEQFKAKDIKVGINTNGSAATLKNVLKVFDAGLDEMVISWHPLNKRVNPKEASSEMHLQKLLDQLPAEYLNKMHMIRVVDTDEIPIAKAEMQPYKDQGLRSMIKRKRNLGHVNGKQSDTPPEYCSFLAEPEFAVLWDGTIVSCCEVYDINKGGVFGNVHDDVLPVKNTGCELCAGCPGYGGNSMETEKVDW